jgi:hypothetical protein
VQLGDNPTPVRCQCAGVLAGAEYFSALWETKWSVGLLKTAGEFPAEDWAATIACLRRIISEEPARSELPGSDQEWAQMFLNRSMLFLMETLMKMIAAREQSQLEARRLRREADVDWLGIKHLREELGWNLVEEGGGGVSSSCFLNMLNERLSSQAWNRWHSMRERPLWNR